MIRNKTILITGASRGLGKRLTEHYENDNKVISIKGRKYCDFRDKDQINEVFKTISNNYEIDIIIHCAGGGFKYNDDFPSWEQLEELYQVNYVAPAIINKYIIPKMIKRGKGKVIHISSVAARSTGASVGYSSVKAAVLAYVRLLGNKLANTGVTVTGIIPASFIAEGNNWDMYTKESAPFLDGLIERNCPKGRLGIVDEYIPIIDFLCSEGSNAMCGCCVPIDNGEGVTYP